MVLIVVLKFKEAVRVRDCIVGHIVIAVDCSQGEKEQKEHSLYIYNKGMNVFIIINIITKLLY